MTRRNDIRAWSSAALLVLLAGCAEPYVQCVTQFPPEPSFAPDHRHTLDELIARSIHHNAGLDVARYEAESVRGLVDQVKALWLPVVHYGLAVTAYDNDFSYEANAFDVASINVPITGSYNITNTAAIAQILTTFGKRTSGLKQAKMFAAIKKLDVLRQQDAVALSVATYYHLICLTSEIDRVLEDAQRRVRVYAQVAREQNALGSLRVSRLDTLQADLFLSQLDQIRVAVQAGRQQAYAALRQSVGVGHGEPLLLADTSLPPAMTPEQIEGVYATIVKGFAQRPELRMVDLFARIRAEQVTFAKAAWAPDIAFLGSFVNVSGNGNTIVGVIDGLVAGLVVSWPVYNPARRARLREALALEKAAESFQRQVEELVTLEIEVSAIDAQSALKTVFQSARAAELAHDHYDATRQAYSRELIPASDVVVALGVDTLVQIQHLAALFSYHQSRAKLRRVTAEREAALGY